MTSSPAIPTVHVEGNDDRGVVARWFPGTSFQVAGGKDQVRRRVATSYLSFGLLDRDFAEDDVVQASRDPGGRLFLLARYCIENYLLEPPIIAEAVRRLAGAGDISADWLDEGAIAQRIFDWGNSVALYAAANSIVAEWRDTVEAGFLRYLGPLPPLPWEDVLRRLQQRLEGLPLPEHIEASLRDRYTQVQADLQEWAGLHRWINGKVLLEAFLYPQVFSPLGVSQVRMRDELIAAGMSLVPGELVELAQRWSARPYDLIGKGH